MKKNFIFSIAVAMFLLLANIGFAKGWVEVDGEWFYQNADGTYLTDSIVSSGEDKFYLDEFGKMARDVLLEDFNSETYYFGSNGVMVRNTWVTVDPTVVENRWENEPGVYYYYFGKSGQAYRAKNGELVKKTVDGQKYLFDEKGHRLHGWINESGEVINEQEDPFIDALYYCGEEYDGVMRTGWVQFDGGTIDDTYIDYAYVWLYFDNNGKKVSGLSSTNNEKTKKIDGLQYIFDQNGVMKYGWQDVEKSDDKSTGKFYSENEDGFLQKKSWVYTVPPEEFDDEKNSDYNSDIKRWFYVGGNGNITANTMKKIDTKWYMFDQKGIMRTGLVVCDYKGQYKFTVDTDRIDAVNYIVKRRGGFEVLAGGSITDVDAPEKKYIIDTDENEQFIEVRNYGDYHADKMFYFFREEDDGKHTEGQRIDKTAVNIQFADGEKDFYADSNGAYQGYKAKQKKYFDGGIALKADQDIGYGLVSVDEIPNQSGDIYREIKYDNNDATRPSLVVVDTQGKKLNKNNSVKKDRNGNFWIIDDKGLFTKIITCDVKYGDVDKKMFSNCTKNKTWLFKSDYEYKDDKGELKTKKMFIPFSDDTEQFLDVYGQYCSLKRDDGGYELKPSYETEYALNFIWADEDSAYIIEHK